MKKYKAFRHHAIVKELAERQKQQMEKAASCHPRVGTTPLLLLIVLLVGVAEKGNAEGAKLCSHDSFMHLSRE